MKICHIIVFIYLCTLNYYIDRGKYEYKFILYDYWG